MKPRTLYFNLCNEVDRILIDSGIRDRCIECSNQRGHKEEIDGIMEWVGGGCCNGCKHLSKKGCKIQSLSCKLWLCEERKKEWKTRLAKIRKLKRFNEIIDIAVENNLLIFRAGFYSVNKNLKTIRNFIIFSNKGRETKTGPIKRSEYLDVKKTMIDVDQDFNNHGIIRKIK